MSSLHGVRVCIKLKGRKIGDCISVQVYSELCFDALMGLVEAIGLDKVFWIDMYPMPGDVSYSVWQYDSYVNLENEEV